MAADIDSVVLVDFADDMGPMVDADYRMIAVTSVADADHAWDIDSSHLDYGHGPSFVNLADRSHRGPYRLRLVSMSLPRDCAGTINRIQNIMFAMFERSGCHSIIPEDVDSSAVYPYRHGDDGVARRACHSNGDHDTVGRFADVVAEQLP